MYFFLARGYPTLHLAMVFDDGLVYDFSVKDKTLQNVNPLMKLPKSKQYFGYSNENGVLYFIHSNIGNEKFITKFHKSFKNRGHMIVPKSKRSNTLMKEILSEVSEQFQYRHGVLMGHRFWTFGGYAKINLMNYFFRSKKTTIWSTKKQVWIKGPEIITSEDNNSTHFFYKSMDYAFCIASVINSTTIAMIGKNTFVCFDIETNRWTDYPDFPYPYTYSDIPEMVATMINSNKSRKRYALTEKVSKFQALDIIVPYFFSRSLDVFLQLSK